MARFPSQWSFSDLNGSFPRFIRRGRLPLENPLEHSPLRLDRGTYVSKIGFFLFGGGACLFQFVARDQSLGARLPATGVIWALRAQFRKKKSESESPGPLGPGGPKSPKRSLKRVKIDSFVTILTRFRLRFGLFGPPGPEAPGTHFRTFFPKGPKSKPCSRQTGSQIKANIFPNFFFFSHFWLEARKPLSGRRAGSQPQIFICIAN